MKEINLIKLHQTENSTVSRMFIGGVFCCFVIEDGEHENKVHGSTRIPEGRYQITKDKTTRFAYQYGYCWHVQNVPGFSEIKIHKGNWITDTEGCLLPNRDISYDGKNWHGINSRSAYDKMMEMLKDSDTHVMDVIR